jgi:hypothetical protein
VDFPRDQRVFCNQINQKNGNAYPGDKKFFDNSPPYLNQNSQPSTLCSLFQSPGKLQAKDGQEASSLAYVPRIRLPDRFFIAEIKASPYGILNWMVKYYKQLAVDLNQFSSYIRIKHEQSGVTHVSQYQPQRCKASVPTAHR